MNINNYILSPYTSTFNNKNVGINKTLTIDVIQLKDDENNTNYVFVIPYTTSGNITPLQLTFSNTTKTYNGNTNVSTLFAPSNVITGDIINTISIIGNYNTKNITANIINLTGDIQNNNYTLPSSIAGTITQAQITPIFTSIPKKNDGNTNANVIYTLNGVVNGETLSIRYNAVYTSANIGNNIPINITVIQFIPNIYSSNYVLNNTSTTIYGDIINGLTQYISRYISRYTTLNMLSRLEVKETNTAAYAVIGYKSKKIDPLFSVFLQNL